MEDLRADAGGGSTAMSGAAVNRPASRARSEALVDENDDDDDDDDCEQGGGKAAKKAKDRAKKQDKMTEEDEVEIAGKNLIRRVHRLIDAIATVPSQRKIVFRAMSAAVRECEDVIAQAKEQQMSVRERARVNVADEIEAEYAAKNGVPRLPPRPTSSAVARMNKAQPKRKKSTFEKVLSGARVSRPRQGRMSGSSSSTASAALKGQRGRKRK